MYIHTHTYICACLCACLCLCAFVFVFIQWVSRHTIQTPWFPMADPDLHTKSGDSHTKLEADLMALPMAHKRTKSKRLAH